MNKKFLIPIYIFLSFIYLLNNSFSASGDSPLMRKRGPVGGVPLAGMPNSSDFDYGKPHYVHKEPDTDPEPLKANPSISRTRLGRLAQSIQDLRATRRKQRSRRKVTNAEWENAFSASDSESGTEGSAVSLPGRNRSSDLSLSKADMNMKKRVQGIWASIEGDGPKTAEEKLHLLLEALGINSSSENRTSKKETPPLPTPPTPPQTDEDEEEWV